MKVYMKIFDWSTTYDESVEVELFSSYEKAKTRFLEIIINEQNPEMSWVGEVINEYGDVNEDYTLDTNIADAEDNKNLYWNVTNKNDWNIHDFLDLKEMEVM